MYEFRYEYIKQNMVKMWNCVIWIQIVHIVHIKTDDIYKDIAEDVETRFDTSNYEWNKSYQKKIL